MMPLALWLYLGFSKLSGPLWRWALKRRLAKGQEDPARLPEKLGQASLPRPEGRLVWFHAVSVGEALALLTLLRRLSEARPELTLLLTTSTTGSLEALARTGLPPRVLHQLAPIDSPAAIKRFLAHWRPEAAVISEADLWPATLMEVARAGIPMININTTVTERRYLARRKFRTSYRRIFGLFRRMLVQDAEALERFALLGAERSRMEVMGVLKSASDPLPDAPEERARLASVIGTRPAWAAAVSHAEEDELMLEAQSLALQTRPDLLMILAPRQLAQGDAAEAMARARFTHVARRSKGEPLTPQTEVYIADTIGEMGLWYRLVPVAFLGHSLARAPKPMTGKNPFEAMALGSVVLHGPNHDHFTETYRRLGSAGAVVEVQTPEALAAEVLRLQDPAARAPLLKAAEGLLAENQRPLEIALARVQDLIDGQI